MDDSTVDQPVGPVDVPKPSTSRVLVCLPCNITFSNKNNLQRHQKKAHSIVHDAQYNKACGLCTWKCRTIGELHGHLEKNHPDLKLNFQNELFYSEEDFEEWKRDIEQKTVSSYVCQFSRTENNTKSLQYKCNRSGTAKLTDASTRKRRGKLSIKTGVTCPAMMKVTKVMVDDLMEISVSYQSTHLGHKNDASKIRLKKERIEVTNMLTSRIPSVVMDKSNALFSPSKLTKRLDVYNISRDYNVLENVHQDDLEAVDITVRKMMLEDYNPVLVYKPIGEVLDDYPNIARDSFLLGISSKAQMELLQLYGQDSVMLDTTHGMDQYKYDLTTLMVNDNNHKGLPVAVYFSKGGSSEDFKPFFDAIKMRLPDFQTSVMMTDDTNAFINAWNESFQSNTRHLLCSWHVMRNLKRQLNAKVKDKEVKVKLEKDLKKVVYELDLTTFQGYLINFLNLYKEEKDFIKYFHQCYLERQEKWAYCYRVNLEINTNMKLERWHQQIKYEEAGGSTMNKALNLVLQAMSKKLESRLIAIEKVKLFNQIRMIRKRHNDSKKMNEDVYSVMKKDETTFIVTKTQGSEIVTYDVEIKETRCECPTRCVDCKICIHGLSCSCIDYRSRCVICKHIHFVAQKFPIQESCSTESSWDGINQDHLVIYVSEQEISQNIGEEIILEQMRKKPRMALDDVKLSINELWQNISRQIHLSNSLEDVQHVKETLKNLQTYLEQRAKRPVQKTSAVFNLIRPNKKISPQRKNPKSKQQKNGGN